MQRKWVTGDCWLWCERTAVPVLWLGPLQWEGQHAPLYACEPCIHRLEQRVHAYLLQKRAAPA